MTPGECNMYTAIFTIASTLVAYAGMELYGASAVMAGTFVIAVMGFGMTADIMRAEIGK
jgi:hypothetical protein